MKNLLPHKLKTTGAVLSLAALLATLTTAAVIAAIPDNNNLIHGCYSNTGGTLRVIDSANSSCSALETPLVWGQNLSGNSVDATAYAHFSSSQWDSARSKNIASVQFVSVPSPGTDACITAIFEPKSIIVTGGNTSPIDAAVRNAGMNPENNGWSSAEANQVCGTNGNAFVAMVGDSTFVSLTQ